MPWRLVSLMLSLAAVALSLVVLILEIFAPQMAWLLGGGFEASLLAETARLMRLTVPAVIFLSLSGITTGLLYALKRFTYPAFTAAIFNASIVVGAILLADRLGIASVALGLLVGAVFQVVVQVPGLRDMRFTFSLALSHPGLRRVLILYLPIVAGLVISQIQVAIDRNRIQIKARCTSYSCSYLIKRYILLMECINAKGHSSKPSFLKSL